MKLTKEEAAALKTAAEILRKYDSPIINAWDSGFQAISCLGYGNNCCGAESRNVASFLELSAEKQEISNLWLDH